MGRKSLPFYNQIYPPSPGRARKNMSKPKFYPANVFDWALRQGYDNSRINIELQSVDPVFFYGSKHLMNELAPHLAIFPADEDIEILPAPDLFEYDSKVGKIAIYFL